MGALYKYSFVGRKSARSPKMGALYKYSFVGRKSARSPKMGALYKYSFVGRDGPKNRGGTDPRTDHALTISAGRPSRKTGATDNLCSSLELGEVPWKGSRA